MANRRKERSSLRVLALIITTLSALDGFLAFSTGAGSQACVNFLPQHNNEQGQTSPVPYVVELTKHTYEANERILVRLRGCDKNTFKGFLIEPRPAENPAQTVLVGTFQQYSQQPPYQYACSTNQALTHVSAEEKTSLTFVWQAPPTPQGHVVFRTTFLTNYSTFWVGGNSAVVYDVSGKPFSQQQLSTLLNPVDPICIPATAPSVTSAPIANATEQDDLTSAPPMPVTERQTTTTTIVSETMPNTTKTTIISTERITSPIPISTMQPNTTVRQISTTTTHPTTSPITTIRTTKITNTMTPFTSPSITLTPSTSPVITTKAPATMTTTFVPWNPVFLGRDPDCGVNKECYDDCSGSVCSLIIYWKHRGEYVDFVIKSAVGQVTGDMWMSMGLSYDEYMGNDSVIDCVLTKGVVSVRPSYNAQGYQNQLVFPQVGISSLGGSLENGIFTCAFRRQTVVSSQDKVYDLNNAWHVLFAHGRARSGLKMPHGANDVLASRNLVDFGASRPTTTTPVPTLATTPWPSTPGSLETTTEAVSVTIMPFADETAECGTTQGCYYPCAVAAHCDLAVSWTNRQHDMDFRVKATVPGSGDKWVAIGFSEDDKMGDDYVIECVSNGEEVRVFQSYNYGKKNNRLTDANIEITKFSGTFIDGIFSCNFTRDKVVDGTDKIYNLEKDWYILYAYGSAVAGQKRPHSYTDLPTATAHMIDFQSYESISGTASHLLLKVHGCLMVFAWICAASIGIIAARYYKPLWPHQKACGQMIWFQIHRLCMVLAFIATVSGFVIIFVEIGGYSNIIGANFYKAHPVLGIIVTILTVLNPMMAMFRPHPGTSNRPVFNWAHWMVGTGTHMLAVITIFSGVGLHKVHVPGYVTYILIGYVIYQVLISFILEVHQCFASKKANKRNGQYLYEMQRKPYGVTRPPAIPLDIEPPFSNMKKAILGSHVLVILVFSLIIGLIIAII